MAPLRPASRSAVRATVAVASAVLWLSCALRASDLSDDLAARRARLMDRLGPDAIVVLRSAPPRTYSLDVDYEYRQDSNLYYLTALTQENTTLVLMPGNADRREILFVADRDPVREHWFGHVLSRDEAAARTGIRTVMSSAQLDGFLAAILAGRAAGAVTETDAHQFFEALQKGTARLALPMDPTSLDAPLTRTQEFARTLRDRFAGLQVVDALGALTDLRLVKTPYEQAVLRKASRISAEAQLAGMRAARPGAFEYQVKAAIEAVHRASGAVSWAYPSIVGSGPNTTILHYPESARRLEPGDLVLADAACNFEYMSPDITRTYPIDGTFSAAQRELYALVLEAQDEAVRKATAGSSLAAIHTAVVDVLKAGLFRLGLITDTAGEQYRMWFTHGATHFIGIDVHDVGERTVPLRPGMAFAIEPGVYVRQTVLDALPRTAENVTLIARIQAAVAKYDNLGVRLEDSFLLEDSGPVRLTGDVPRTVSDIESFMRARPTASPKEAR